MMEKKMETSMILQVPGAMEALDFSVSSKSTSTFKPGPCHERLATVLRQSTWAPPAWLSGQPTLYPHEASTRHHGTRTARPCLQPLRILLVVGSCTTCINLRLAALRHAAWLLGPGAAKPRSSHHPLCVRCRACWGLCMDLQHKATCFAFSMCVPGHFLRIRQHLLLPPKPCLPVASSQEICGGQPEADCSISSHDSAAAPVELKT